jgi:[CysO sulfur-carrier protein]-S-L-cysteine hydrolase
LSSPKISRSNLDQIITQAEREFPYECCGFVIGSQSASASQTASIEEIRPIANIQNTQHAKDPAAFPRDARTAFLMDPRQHLAVMREIDDRKLALKIVYHSHPDHEAYFSPTDRRQACSFDPDYPDYPETAYVVISIMGGRFNRAAAFVWDAERKEFVETELTIE